MNSEQMVHVLARFFFRIYTRNEMKKEETLTGEKSFDSIRTSPLYASY